MSEYPKTQNLYASNGVNGAGHERGPQYGYGHPSFPTIGEWTVLDKLDGMNMRVTYHGAGPAEPGSPDLDGASRKGLGREIPHRRRPVRC